MDEFIIEEELGSGGYGIAYLVTRKKDNRKLVAKRMCLDIMTSEDKQKAIDEARTLAVMKHENICTFEDFFKERGKNQEYLYIIMEYCAGGSLQTRIKNQKGEAFHPDQINQWLHSICLALAHVHRRGGIHRDIKPENIFLTEEGVVKIGDFGIAIVATLTRKSIIGTPTHMAPEVVFEKGHDYHCDMWSLGVVLYELITFKLPFQATNPVVLGHKICKGDYDPITGTTSLDLCDLVKELLNIEPSKRPDCTEILSRDFLKNQQQAHEKLKQRREAKEKERKEEEERNRREVFERQQNKEDELRRWEEELRRWEEELKEKQKQLHAREAEDKKFREVVERQRTKEEEGKAAEKLRQLPIHETEEEEREQRVVQGQRGEENETTRASVIQKRTCTPEEKNLVEEYERGSGEWSSALHRASAEGQTDVVMLLIQNGADVNNKNKDGITPLHWASYQGKTDVVTLLIQNGADVNHRSNNGNASLHWASINGQLEVIKLLLRNNADKNLKTRIWIGNTPRDVARNDETRRLFD